MPHLTKALQGLIQALEDVQRASLTDDLTQLGNRRALHAALDEIAASRKKTWFAFGDLSGFKAINDTYGHDAGDAAIALVGEWLAGLCRSEPLMAYRQSGDEFVVLDQAESAERLVATLQTELPPLIYDEKTIEVRLSFGYLVLDDDPVTCQKRAEEACAFAKARGTRAEPWREGLPVVKELRWRCSNCNASLRISAPNIPNSPPCPCCGVAYTR